MSNRKFIAYLSLSAGLTIGALSALTRADAGFVVLVNASNPSATLTSGELKKALTGNTKLWPNGAVVQVGVSASETPELRFLAGAIGMSASDLLSRIQQQVFKGEMRRPAILRSSADCVGLARSNPGAICAAAAGTAVPPEAKVMGIR